MNGLHAIQLGAPTNIFPIAVLTNAYSGAVSSAVDLESYDGLALTLKVTTAQAKTCNLKFQWSHDDSAYFDELVEVQGSAASGEQPYTILSRVIQIDMTSTGNLYIARLRRMARYFRVTMKSDATTTGQVRVDIIKLLNGN